MHEPTDSNGASEEVSEEVGNSYASYDGTSSEQGHRYTPAHVHLRSRAARPVRARRRDAGGVTGGTALVHAYIRSRPHVHRASFCQYVNCARESPEI